MAKAKDAFLRISNKYSKRLQEKQREAGKEANIDLTFLVIGAVDRYAKKMGDHHYTVTTSVDEKTGDKSVQVSVGGKNYEVDKDMRFREIPNIEIQGNQGGSVNKPGNERVSDRGPMVTIEEMPTETQHMLDALKQSEQLRKELEGAQGGIVSDIKGMDQANVRPIIDDDKKSNFEPRAKEGSAEDKSKMMYMVDITDADGNHYVKDGNGDLHKVEYHDETLPYRPEAGEGGEVLLANTKTDRSGSVPSAFESLVEKYESQHSGMSDISQMMSK